MVVLDFEYRKYYDSVKPEYISWKFYEPYTRKEPDYGELGLVVTLRTYSRFLEELRRREKWCEIVLRTVEYSMSLDKVTPHKEKIKEAEALFDGIFTMKFFPSGRTLWVGNKNKELGAENFNCAFRVIDGIDAYVEMQYLLMVGCGVGFSVENQYVEKLPTFQTKKQISHAPYTDLYSLGLLKEDTVLSFDSDDLHVRGFTKSITKLDLVRPADLLYKNIQGTQKNWTLRITVGDSKVGWCNALKAYLQALVEPNIKKIVLVYDFVRPAGTKLKNMGGRASGHAPLRKLFKKIAWLIRNSKGKLNSVAAMDLANFIAEVIVVGGVRRSSQIALGDKKDIAFIKAKFGLFDYEPKLQPILDEHGDYLEEVLWATEDPELLKIQEDIDSTSPLFRYQESRRMSNNSIVFRDKPFKKEIEENFEFIADNGEPGILNFLTGKKRRGDLQGLNPCAEILLRNFGLCNLVTINLLAFVENGVLDYKSLVYHAQIISRHASRITLVDLWHPDWDRVQKEDRLLGVSITGLMDAVHATEPGLAWAAVLADMKTEVRSCVDAYHQYLGIPRSLLVTTVKPEGTLSQIPTVSSGCHQSYAPYYFRRIRVSSNDPISQALKDLGIEVVSEKGNWVFKFGVKTNAKFKSVDEKAVDQMERYKLLMECWAEHNVSITVTFDPGLKSEDGAVIRPSEINKVSNWLHKNWDSVLGIAFLKRFDPSSPDPGELPFPNPPYETCSESDYLELKAKLPQFTEEEFISLISKYEFEQEEFMLEAGCEGGACPVR